jgi:aminoglycoside phosphotransferase (APT) family kinase protein
VPSPPPLWIDPTGEALDFPSIIMRFVPGHVNRAELDRMEPAVRRRVDESFVSSLAALHTQDWSAEELPSIPRPSEDDAAASQLDLWEQAYRTAAPGGEPGLTLVLQWLRAHTPVASRVSLIHGDFRYGNLLFDESGVTALVDWELAHFGDPAEDVVWPFRAFRRNTASLAPWPAFLASYEERSGIEIPRENWQFYRVLSAWKTGVICLTARTSFINGGTNDIVNGHMGLNVGMHAEQALRWIAEIEGGSR